MNALDLDLYRAPAPPFTPGRRKKNLFHEVLRRDGFRCTRCGSPDELTMHHRVKVAEGGESVVSNLETLCIDCHQFHHRAEQQFAQSLVRTEAEMGLVAA